MCGVGEEMKDTIAIKIPEIAREVQVAEGEWVYLDKDGNVVGGRHMVTYPDLNAPRVADLDEGQN